MRKVWAVVRREFVERVRTRGFWIGTLVFPLLFAAIVIVPSMFTGAGGTKRIVVVDRAGGMFGVHVTEALDASPSFDATRILDAPGVVDSLTRVVGAKGLDGFLILPPDVVETGSAEYRASNVSALDAIGDLRSTLRQAIMTARLRRAGIDARIVERASGRVDLDTKKISGSKTTGESAGQSFALAYFMAMILYMAILIYGIGVMQSVLEEKTTRVVEVLVSSLKPFQLMAGKLIGVGGASLFQFLIWGVSVKLLLSQRGAVTGGGFGDTDAAGFFQLPPVPAATIAIVIVFFVGGFLLYSSMFAAVGAMSNSLQEAQQGQQPVTMLLVLSLVSMFAMLNNPGSTYAVVLSLIPFTAPIAMPVRWTAGSLPVWELAASMAMLGIGIVVIVWVAARIYRVGILMTGKRPSIKEVVRWVRVG